MSQSTESSPASGPASPASLHQQGSVIDFDGRKAQCAFGEYVKECDRPTAAFDIGIYNKVKKSQSVKGDAIVRNKKLIEASIACLPGLRFRPTQLQLQLEDLDTEYKCNPTTRAQSDWSRATMLSLSVLLSHVRRLRNAKLFAQCLARTSVANQQDLIAIQKRVCEFCPLTSPSPTTPLKRPICDVESACGSDIVVEEWPSFSSGEEEDAPRGKGSDEQGDGWPDFSSEEELVIRERVASGPAPSKLSARQRTGLNCDLQHSLQTSSWWCAIPLRDWRARQEGEEQSQGVDDRRDPDIERKADKSVIQVLGENKWKSACAISHRNSRHHRRLISDFFELAVENGWDIEAMQRQRTLLLDDE